MKNYISITDLMIARLRAIRDKINLKKRLRQRANENLF